MAAQGIAVPDGGVARSAGECREFAEKLRRPVVVKAQVWGTGRAQAGGIRFADSPLRAAEAAQEIFSVSVGGASVEVVLVEERLLIEREFYAGLIVDDRLRKPMLLLSTAGGTGVEERSLAQPQRFVRLPVSVRSEPPRAALASALAQTDAPQDLHEALSEVLVRLYRVAMSCEARVAEINPLALTRDGRLVALDCRISTDDYAVFRHPDLGVEVAREFGHPPTELEKIAWAVERDDYRGTFYFVELRRDHDEPGTFIGFHGAGGGGSMASLDAAIRSGLRPANYTDTSGNPAASKVYRAAKIILSQPGIRGYFLSGSGVASQEQFHLARALVKAFREDRPTIPAVLRLGGNGEDQAARIIQEYTADLPAPVEVYQKAHTAEFCAERLRELVDEHPESASLSPELPAEPRAQKAEKPYSFETRTGRITYDHALCIECETKACVKECVPQILSLEEGLPVLNISLDDAKRGKCIECLACEVECWFQGKGGASIDLPIAGLKEYRAKVMNDSQPWPSS